MLIERGVEHLVGAEVRDREWHLILLGGGAVSRSHARGAQVGVLALAVRAYGVVASEGPRT